VQSCFRPLSGPCDLASLSMDADMHMVHGLAYPKECSLSHS